MAAIILSACVSGRICRSVARLLGSRGLGPQVKPAETDTLQHNQPLLAELYSASISGRVATGPRAGVVTIAPPGEGDAGVCGGELNDATNDVILIRAYAGYAASFIFGGEPESVAREAATADFDGVVLVPAKKEPIPTGMKCCHLYK